MSKHTPGPWVIKGTLFGEWNISSEYSVAGKKLENGRQHIANSPSASSKLNPDYFAMFMANAQLIAAAPDLLEALECVEQETALISRMKNCELRRGKGSFGIAVMDDELALEWQEYDKIRRALEDKRFAAIAKARGEA